MLGRRAGRLALRAVVDPSELVAHFPATVAYHHQAQLPAVSEIAGRAAVGP
jgi:hypothetical protein